MSSYSPRLGVLPDSVFFALGHAVLPSEARNAIKSGSIIGLEEDEIKESLRYMAITVYNHQRTSKRYKAKMLIGKNPLPFFLCACHGGEVFEHHTTLNPGLDCKAPSLPLQHWESLYYALVAEIREVYLDLQQHLETELEGGNFVLHSYGANSADDNTPFTARAFAAQLDYFWQDCMHPRLLGPLEDAVRYANAFKPYRSLTDHNNFNDNLEKVYQNLIPEDRVKALDVAKGMLEVTSMPPSAVVFTIWDKYAPRLAHACQEYLNTAVDIIAQRDRFLHEREAEEDAAERRKPVGDMFGAMENPQLQCTCEDDCECRICCKPPNIFKTCECAEDRCKEIENRRKMPLPPPPPTRESAEDVQMGPSPGHRVTVDDTTQMQLATGEVAEWCTAEPNCEIRASVDMFNPNYPGPCREYSGSNSTQLAAATDSGKQQNQKKGKGKDPAPTGFFNSFASLGVRSRKESGAHATQFVRQPAHALLQSRANRSRSNPSGGPISSREQSPASYGQDVNSQLCDSPGEFSAKAQTSSPDIPEPLRFEKRTKSAPTELPILNSQYRTANEGAGQDTSALETAEPKPTEVSHSGQIPLRKLPARYRRNRSKTGDCTERANSPNRSANEGPDPDTCAAKAPKPRPIEGDQWPLMDMPHQDPYRTVGTPAQPDRAPPAVPERSERRRGTSSATLVNEANTPRPERPRRYVSAGGPARLEDREEIAAPEIGNPVEKGVDMSREEVEAGLKAREENLRRHFNTIPATINGLEHSQICLDNPNREADLRARVAKEQARKEQAKRDQPSGGGSKKK